MGLAIVKDTQKSSRGKRKRVDTVVLDTERRKRLKAPPFQRPFKPNAKVTDVVRIIKETGVFPGILTIGLFQNEEWVIDGQHRLQATDLSERNDVLADVHYIECDSMQEMAEEYEHLNSSLVRFGPDDLLKSKEFGSVPLQTIRRRCKFVGYDNVRRNDRAPILRMSALLRCWTASEHETPAAHGSAAGMADTMTVDSANQLCDFLLLAFEAWGRDVSYQRMWGALNLTLCMWIYRRIVIAKSAANQRRISITSEIYVKCLSSLSADSKYIDWLVGRALSEDHRTPAYDRIKRIMVSRLRLDGVDAAPKFPMAPWNHT